MSKKFERIAWKRGEFSPGQLANDVVQNAVGGAAAGALVGAPGGVTALPGAGIGAIGGALFGGISHGANALWYATRSTEDKASWQAGDIEENAKVVARLLKDSGNPDLIHIGDGIARIGTEFKQYIDYHVQGKRDADLSQNVFQNPEAPAKSGDPNDPRTEVLEEQKAESSQESNQAENQNSPILPSDEPWYFTSSSKKFVRVGSKFTRVANDNGHTLFGDGVGVVFDVLGTHMARKWYEQNRQATPEQVQQVANTIKSNLAKMSESELLEVWNDAHRKGWLPQNITPNTFKAIEQVVGKSLKTVSQAEMKIAAELLENAVSLEHAQNAYSLVLNSQRTNGKTPPLKKMLEFSLTEDIANAAQKGENVTQQALQQGTNTAKQLGKGVAQNAWKGFLLPAAVGTGAQLLTGYGLDVGERWIKGNSKVITERSTDAIDALQEIMRLVPNNPGVLTACQNLVKAFQRVILIQQAASAKQEGQITEALTPRQDGNPQMMTPGVLPLSHLQSAYPTQYGQ